MNKKDKEWLKKCIKEPKKYKIFVDNDEIFIVNVGEEDIVYYTFSNYGYEFIYFLLKYLKTNVDYV
nr:MAG TPA: hypothetical protein [Caudoviricetes sp.]